MFPDYVPPEEIGRMLSQAAIVAADIDPEGRRVWVAAHSETYIPRRLSDKAVRDIAELYGLRSLELTITHPETELHKIEQSELMLLFTERDSMTRGALAGAKWRWEGTKLTVSLLANGRAGIEKQIPSVCEVLRSRFAAPVTIQVEAGAELTGQALLDAMDKLREETLSGMPAARAKAAPMEEKKPAESEAFTGNPSGAPPHPWGS